ncbi:MAG: cell division ATP-binding protein FtsE [Lachnospiraceae bacterium]|nr:cell division ATP-binding protein FtsE [Lachnospiraceae bacterium]
MIVLDNVTKYYEHKPSPALNKVNITIKKGEFVFIVGESGSGKSTLIRLLLRETLPTEGSITVGDFKLDKLRRSRVPKLRRNMGVVFQDFRLLKDRNVYDNVAFAQRIVEASPRQMRKNVPEILGKVGLAGKYRARTDELSGGEQQRVALARALVNKPQILLADEPTGNLDPKNTIEIMNLLEQVNKEGTTVLVVTHNDKIVNNMNHRVITIKKGVVISDIEEGNYDNED